ncbi:hypothetical protein Pyrfu_1070 [Pyrolobus fumarii 1A]|uniref:Uncharacterized protein n=1 Tax=Pyrolobus fumarii (strain DSM 11204 / 1A) TaxID=694429 RepID=G0EF41_PYRF1|nr:hypothetical protein [Pyrolobus fumarii]AEM38938.1 hypothetical protein Pyrfu_1070 [Pyrolobus fumarii 1A]
MLLPPLTFEPRVPRRFKELSSAAQGKLAGITGLFDFLRDILVKASGFGEEPKPVSEITGGIVRVEKLGEKYPLLHNFNIGDILYYLRIAQAFGVLEVVAFTETPRRLNEVGVSRSIISDIVVSTINEPTASFVFSFYVGLMAPTPARYALFKGTEAGNILDLAKREDFRKGLVYNTVLSAQVLLRSGGVEAGKPWFEPISDLSGIIAFLGTLQVAKIRPNPNKLLGLRVLSKIKRRLAMHETYGEYVLPRGTLLLEFEKLVTGRDRDEKVGVDYEALNVGMAKDVSWFRGKVSSRTYMVLERLLPALKERWGEIEEVVYKTFNLEREKWYKIPASLVGEETGEKETPEAKQA